MLAIIILIAYLFHVILLLCNPITRESRRYVWIQRIRVGRRETQVKVKRDTPKACHRHYNPPNRTQSGLREVILPIVTDPGILGTSARTFYESSIQLNITAVYKPTV